MNLEEELISIKTFGIFQTKLETQNRFKLILEVCFLNILESY